jgi:hypothetical protein
MKAGPWIVAIAIAITIACFAACNYTDGACWPVGQTDGNAGVGTGTIVHSGAGGSLGDGPSQGTSGAACNSTSKSDTPKSDPPQSDPDAGGDPASTWIYCKDPDPVACFMTCAEIGIYCTGFRPHPNSPSVGLGRLIGCKDGTPTSVCSYVYPNADVCNFYAVLGSPGFSFCIYSGGN